MGSLGNAPGVPAWARPAWRRVVTRSALGGSSTVIRILSMALFATGAAAQCSLFPTGGYVGIFGDRFGTESTVVFGEPLRPDTLHVLAFLQGATSDGFTGVQFRIEVSDAEGWFFLTTWSGDVVVGNAFDIEPDDPQNPAGVHMSWFTCRSSPSAIVPIGTIVALPATGRTTDLLVKRDLPPSNPGAPCARFARCDPPLFSRAPMPAREVDAYGEEIVFRTHLVRDIPVAVDGRTWGAIKKLYVSE